MINLNIFKWQGINCYLRKGYIYTKQYARIVNNLVGTKNNSHRNRRKFKMELTEVLDLADKSGFTRAAELKVSTIDLNPQVRQMCADNKCKIYDTNWACPPGCGTLDECGKKVNNYQYGVILQTTGELEDSFDFEGMEEIKEKHNVSFDQLVNALFEKKADMLPLGDGCCSLCKKCTYPDEACRFPEKAFSSMEAFGILVSDLCKLNNLEYYYGPNTLTYVGCILFN